MVLVILMTGCTDFRECGVVAAAAGVISIPAVLGAGCRFGVVVHRIVSQCIYLSLFNQNSITDRAVHTCRQTGFGAGGIHTGYLFFGVSLYIKALFTWRKGAFVPVVVLVMAPLRIALVAVQIAADGTLPICAVHIVQFMVGFFTAHCAPPDMAIRISGGVLPPVALTAGNAIAL